MILLVVTKEARCSLGWQQLSVSAYGILTGVLSCRALTHWGRVTHICVGTITNIGSDNGLSPDRRQAIIWTNARILLIIGIDHDTVCAGVVCAATPGTARVGRPSRGRLRPRRPAHECCAGSGSTNHDSADRMSGQFLFYHEKEAKHNDKSREDHDDERHAESPWLTTPLWWWKRP